MLLLLEWNTIRIIIIIIGSWPGVNILSSILVCCACRKQIEHVRQLRGSSHARHKVRVLILMFIASPPFSLMF